MGYVISIAGDTSEGGVGECPSEEGQHLRLSNLTKVQQEDMIKLLAEFPTVTCKKLGRTSAAEHKLHVEAVQPIRQQAYQVPVARREVLKKELDRMLELEVIRPSTSPWASPVVMVDKKDGGTRLCVDYRKVNQVTKFDAYPMPRVEEVLEEVLEEVGPAEFITTLDLAQGYWQVPMAAESQEITAFTTPYGLYEFTVMPFGLHNAPATFQRMMNEVLRDCRGFSRAYIDDIAVYSQTWQEHLSHLRSVLTCLQLAGLTLKLPKCQFALKKVHYLGYLIGGGCIEPDPGKIEAVSNFKQPATKSEVRAFHGLASYYRKFVPNFAIIAAPLTDLLKKGQPEKIEWSVECEQAFKKLKYILTTEPVLKAPDYSVPFVVQTDASDCGIGAVLSQTGEDGKEHPIAYASRKLQSREKHYATIEKECLAIVWALKYFYRYLYGQKFTIETDHQPLKWLQQMKSSNQRLTRWALILQQHKYEITHRPGSKNANADGLSRAPAMVDRMELRVEECDDVP